MTLGGLLRLGLGQTCDVLAKTRTGGVLGKVDLRGARVTLCPEIAIWWPLKIDGDLRF